MSNLVVTESICQQVVRLCREQIATGSIKPDEQFPSERDLAATYGISRATANKVVANLIAENLLYHKKGIGTFVTGHRGLHLSLIEMESFTEQAKALGLKPATELLAFQDLGAKELPTAARASLNPQPGERFYYSQRLRLADGVPVLLEHRWIKASLLPGLKGKDMKGSFYTLLRERYRLALEGEQHEIGARAADAESAAKLQVGLGAPLLVVEGPGYTSGDRPLWHQILLCRSDRYHLENRTRSLGQPGRTCFRFVG